MKLFQQLFVIAFLSLGFFAVWPVTGPSTNLAWAQTMTLQDAQSQGLVGELQDGYIGIVKDAPGVSALVNDINLQRRQLYREIARKNNIPLNTVERLAAEKAIKRVPQGQYVQDAGGKWVRK
ncbi:MAG: YdbL family protein [Rhodospirillales bacterium]